MGEFKLDVAPGNDPNAGWEKLNRLWLLTVAQLLVGGIQMCLGVWF